MDEAEILRQLRHYFKLWKKGGFISAALKDKLDNLLFYKDWEISGISHQSSRQKAYLIKKHGGVCQTPGCGNTTDLTQDHIVPKSKGGKNGLHNKQLLCRKCNKEKADKMPHGQVNL